MRRDGKQFTMVPSWLDTVPKAVKPSYGKVLTCLLRHKGRNDTCHVSGTTIARETHLSPDVVFDALGVWEDLGVIKRSKRYSNSNVYQFDDHLLFHGEPNYSLLPTFQAMRKAEAKKKDLHRRKRDGVCPSVTPFIGGITMASIAETTTPIRRTLMAETKQKDVSALSAQLERREEEGGESEGDAAPHWPADQAGAEAAAGGANGAGKDLEPVVSWEACAPAAKAVAATADARVWDEDAKL